MALINVVVTLLASIFLKKLYFNIERYSDAVSLLKPKPQLVKLYKQSVK